MSDVLPLDQFDFSTDALKRMHLLRLMDFGFGAYPEPLC
jgi:hypothetical protein